MWGGLPFMYPSNTALKYLHHTIVIDEEDIEPGARFRARQGMIKNVRGYKSIKDGIGRRIATIELEKKRAKAMPDQMSTSGVSASKLTEADEYWAPMDPIFYHEKSCSFRTTLTRCPLFKKKSYSFIGTDEPRCEEVLGLIDIRRRMIKNPSEKQSEQ